MKNRVRLPGSQGKDKRRDLASVVQDVVEKDNGDKYDIKWDHGFLGRQLSVGAVNIHGDGHLFSLYTINYVPKSSRKKLESSFEDLPDFNSVAIQIPSGKAYRCLGEELPEIRERYEKAKKMADRIAEKLKAKGYSVEIKEEI